MFLNKYTIYFEKFKRNNNRLIEKKSFELDSNNINYIEISYINELTTKDEAIVHASMLYATNLLSQIITVISMQGNSKAMV